MSHAHREKWGSKMQFLMSCIASAVGLGNVWRFPAICAKNGGGAFLIPYMLVLFVIARPLLVLELSLGQFSSKGSVRCWDVSPIFVGIGLAGTISSVLLSTFYIMLLGWAIIYIALSAWGMCTGTVPWLLDDSTGKFFGVNVLRAIEFDEITPENASTAYAPIWHLVLALVIAWIVIWGTMVFGVEASGKVAYVTALAPYVVLIVLLIVGCCLPGADVGLLYLVWPNFKLILKPETWFQAVGQCFFSLGIGFGGCIMFASFNEFHNDIIKDVLIIGLVDTFTSVLAGFSLMSILGFEASNSFRKIKDDPDPTQYEELKAKCERGQEEIDLKLCVLEGIVGKEGGAGMAFVQYPAAMAEVNKSASGVGGFLGILFYFMLLLLAVGSANGFVGTTVTIISDRKQDWKRSYIVTAVCGISCILGLIYTNGIGAGWFDVVDQHGVTAVVYILAFLEAVAIIYVYGLKNFCDDLEFMRNGVKVGWYLRITWVLLPALMVTIFCAWLATYEFKEHWTLAVKIVAWTITVLCISVIPACAVYKYVEFRKAPWKHNVPSTVFGTLRAIIRPNPKWGPKEPEIRRGWRSFKMERDPSYHICERIRSVFYRLMCKTPPVIPAAPAYSFYTTAGESNRTSVSALASSSVEPEQTKPNENPT